MTEENVTETTPPAETNPPPAQTPPEQRTPPPVVVTAAQQQQQTATLLSGITDALGQITDTLTSLPERVADAAREVSPTTTTSESGEQPNVETSPNTTTKPPLRERFQRGWFGE